jgi:hypothetical protein
MAITVTVTKNRLPSIMARGRQKASMACRRAVMTAYNASVPHTPVDTHQLVTRVLIDAAPGALTSRLVWLMFYALFQARGTSRGVPATNFDTYGFDAAKPRFEQDMRAAYGGV